MAQGDTNITVVGNIVADPELFTPVGCTSRELSRSVHPASLQFPD